MLEKLTTLFVSKIQLQLKWYRKFGNESSLQKASFQHFEEMKVVCKKHVFNIFKIRKHYYWNPAFTPYDQFEKSDEFEKNQDFG